MGFRTIKLKWKLNASSFRMQFNKSVDFVTSTRLRSAWSLWVTWRSYTCTFRL